MYLNLHGRQFLGGEMNKLLKQASRINRDIECHWAELSALYSKKTTKTNDYLESEIKSLKNLIRAKQDLLETLKKDFKIYL